MKNKIKIGIIGGIGPQATAHLYKRIISLAKSEYFAKHNSDFPELIIYSIPVPDFISNQNNIQRAFNMFRGVISDFEQINITHIAIASNTVHLLLDDFKQISTATFLSMINAVVDEVVVSHLDQVGLLASTTTIKTHLYHNSLKEFGVNIVLPSSKDQIKVDQLIKLVIAGQDLNPLRSSMLDIINNLETDKIILGCTELPIALKRLGFSMDKFILSTDILAKKIVEVYYNDEREDRI